MNEVTTVYESAIEDLRLVHKGKVRDIYELDERHLLLVATDRLSAFDCVLPTPIELKGKILTLLSDFWFKRLSYLTKNHLITTEFDKMPEIVRRNESLRDRSMLVRKTNVFPVECVVRGYLEGSGWRDYLATGSICGIELPPGLQQCSKLPSPVFTPSTKAVTGHDENINETQFAEIVGSETAAELRASALKLYEHASQYALTRGIIIADTKFEFGKDENGDILLIDEVLTPDSSRFWSAADYSPGRSQSSFDKQFVREYLETLNWNKQPPAPTLPADVARATTHRYLKAYELLTGQTYNR